MRLATIVVLICLVLGVYPFLPSNAQSIQTNGFSVVNAIWGTSPSSTFEAAPGSQNAPLTITLQYYFYNTAGGVAATIDLPPGFTDTTTGESAITSYISGEVTSGAVVPMTFYLNISPGAQLGAYTFPMVISWGAIVNSYTGQSVPESQSTQVQIGLKGKVTLDVTVAKTAQPSSSSSSLLPGQLNSITFVLSNTGSGPATSINLAASSTAVSMLTTFPEVNSLDANSSVSFDTQIFVPFTELGSQLPITFEISYVDSYGTVESSTETVGLYVLNPINKLSLQSLSINVTLGQNSLVSYLLINSGNIPVCSPTLSLNVPEGLSVIANSSYTDSGLVLQPGDSFKYEAVIASGPKTTEGPYTGTLSVSYTDASGNPYTQSLSLGMVVVGQADLAIQNLVTTQDSSTLYINGTLLNEGLVSAYYTQVYLSALQGGTVLANSTEYIGELDPNSPLPFSMAVSYPAPSSSSTVTLDFNVTYKNDFGLSQTTTAAYPVNLMTSAQLLNQKTIDQPNSTGGVFGLIKYLAPMTIVIVIVVLSLLFVRRRRAPKK